MQIASSAAVTAVGLTAAQTCAAFRARVSGFEEVLYLLRREEPVVGAKVPAHPRLRKTASGWLVSLAVRAIREALSGVPRLRAQPVLLLALPEAYRKHPAMAEMSEAAFIDAISAKLKLAFHPHSRVLRDGHAATIKGLAMARELFAKTDVEQCIVGGVDSLINDTDVQRIIDAHRLRDQKNAQGVIPGEAAAFVIVTRGARPGELPLAQIDGLGFAREVDDILGERHSNGAGLRAAIEAAMRDAGQAEPGISFRVSDMNGERYRAWETVIASTRAYRTRREAFTVWYPAASVGDTGTAASAMSLVVAATALARGYAPGPVGVCEASSDEGLRASCFLSPARGRPAPPFRSKAGIQDIERDHAQAG